MYVVFDLQQYEYVLIKIWRYVQDFGCSEESLSVLKKLAIVFLVFQSHENNHLQNHFSMY